MTDGWTDRVTTAYIALAYSHHAPRARGKNFGVYTQTNARCHKGKQTCACGCVLMASVRLKACSYCTDSTQLFSAQLTPTGKKGKGSPYSIIERRVPELIPFLGSQPAGDGRLPLLSARPAVTPATLKRAAASFAAS